MNAMQRTTPTSTRGLLMQVGEQAGRHQHHYLANPLLPSPQAMAKIKFDVTTRRQSNGDAVPVGAAVRATAQPHKASVHRPPESILLFINVDYNKTSSAFLAP